MLERDFVQLVSDDITASGSIPVSLNEKEIIRIAKKEAEWIYHEWNEAFEETWTIIHPHMFKTRDFSASRTIQLPECVLGIKEFREINDGGRMFGIADPMFSIDRVTAADMYLSPWSSSDTIVYRTIQYSYWDLLRSYILTDIGFDYNPNTHKLKVTGRTPTRAVLIRAYTRIPLENLYDDPLFQRWVIAKCKISMSRILGTFTTTLIGGVTINADMWKSEGQEELTELKEKMKTDNTACWFLTSC